MLPTTNRAARLLFIAVSLCGVLSSYMNGAAAEDTLTAEEFRRSADIADTTMSPYCPGRTLSACPSGDARVLRDQIGEMIHAGRSEAEIREDLQRRFGDRVSAVPAMDGVGLLGWGMPFLMLIVMVCIWYRLSRGSKGAEMPGEDESVRFEDEPTSDSPAGSKRRAS